MTGTYINLGDEVLVNGGVGPVVVSGSPPTSGMVITATSGTTATWQAGGGGGSGITALTGDVTASGTGSVAATVVRLNGATIPAAGSLTTGNVLQVSGASAVTYGALNLGGGAGYITGTLPAGNQAAQTLTGDVVGNTGANTLTLAGDVTGRSGTNTVVKLTGAAGSIPIAATGNILTWAAATTAPGLAQTTATSGSGASLTITSQAPFASGATSPGNIILNTPSPNSTGAPGAVQVQTGGTLIAQIGQLSNASTSTAIWLGNNQTISGTNYSILNNGTGNSMALNSTGSINMQISGSTYWSVTTAGQINWLHGSVPSYIQTTQSSDVAVNNMTFQAQNAFATATVHPAGGNLILTSGIGASVGTEAASESNGKLLLQTGGSTEIALDGYGVSLAASSISLTGQSSITLSGAQSLTPYLQFTGTCGGGGCTVTLLGGANAGFTRWWKVDISGATLTGTLTFAYGSATVAISALTTNQNVIELYSTAANTLVANL